jgi:hypothetical protein
MALINTTTTGIQGTTIFADGTGSLTIQENGATINKIVKGSVFSACDTGVSVQTAANGVSTKVRFNSEIVDLNNEFDSSSTYRFTPTIAGWYQLNYRVTISSTVGAAYVRLFRNGSLFKDSIYAAGYVGAAGGSALVYANGSTDYYEIYFYNGTGATVSLAADTTQSEFSGFLVRAA